MEKMKASILVSDDDSAVLGTARIYLKQHFTEIHTTTNPGVIPELMQANQIDIVLLDMNYKRGEIDGEEGFHWLRRVKEIDSSVQVICMTAYGEIDLAVQTIKEGAADFVIKPWENEKLYATILSTIKLRFSTLEVDKLKGTQQKLSEDSNQSFQHMIGDSLPMRKILNTVEKVAGTDANVLLLGENGTGKELIARMIHHRSLRGTKVLIRVDLGALHENLFESELFGHLKGAYTDAKEDKHGRFELADGGTLFLDEIGNLSLNHQAKLLTALQSSEVTRIGSNHAVKVDIRLVCATNVPLYAMVEEQKFRQDLLYRINTVEIQIPPLRQRQEDIPPLVEHYLKAYCKKYNKEEIKAGKADLKILKSYHWPGNIRELQHAMERMVIMSDDQKLDLGDLIGGKTLERNDALTQSFNLQENEKVLILKALEKNNGNVTQTAKDLGIDRLALYRRFNKFGI